MVFEYSVLAVVTTGVLVSLVYCAITGISPIPSSGVASRYLIALIPEIKNGEICELGAGWGTLAFPIAKRFPAARVTAVELSPLPWIFMQARRLLQRRRNLTVVRGNFLQPAFRFGAEVKVVVCYLHSEALARLRPKLERELPHGTLVISNVFDVPGWEPLAKHRIDCSFCPQIYVYRVPGQHESAYES